MPSEVSWGLRDCPHRRGSEWPPCPPLLVHSQCIPSCCPWLRSSEVNVQISLSSSFWQSRQATSNVLAKKPWMRVTLMMQAYTKPRKQQSQRFCSSWDVLIVSHSVILKTTVSSKLTSCRNVFKIIWNVNYFHCPCWWMSFKYPLYLKDIRKPLWLAIYLKTKHPEYNEKPLQSPPTSGG